MRAKTIRPLNTAKSERFPDGVMPAGTIDDGPESWRLVLAGVAIPEDDECRVKANKTPDELATLQRSYNRLAAGIHPDDWAAFDRGEMIGYDEDGRPVPGPNWCGSEADYLGSGETEESEVLS